MFGAEFEAGHRRRGWSRASVIAGAGHFLAEENHADTLAALQAFLRR